MESVMSTLAAAKRTIVIVGTVPLTDPETWPAVQQTILDRINGTGLQCTVVAESSNQLFQHSLRRDVSYAGPGGSRTTFTQFLYRSRLVEQLLRRNDLATYSVSTLPLPVYVIKVDDDIWFLPALGYHLVLDRFRRLTPGDVWYEMILDYINKLLDPDLDGRYVSPPSAELLELFDQDRVPRGIYPRDCFYDTDHYQYVVWDFVFSRRGELLIHKRAHNAKDNQGMWDKSVGGHISFEKERSSADAAVRELIEELYTNELGLGKTKYSLLSEDPSRVYYLGDWRPEGRGGEYLTNIGLLDQNSEVGEEPWAFFRVPGTIEHNTPRLFPNGKTKRLRVLADVFIFISNPLLTTSYARNELKNSEYLLISPAELKTWIERGEDDHQKPFKVTPDLEFIMSGHLRNIIDEVSQIIKSSTFLRAPANGS